MECFFKKQNMQLKIFEFSENALKNYFNVINKNLIKTKTSLLRVSIFESQVRYFWELV